MTDATPNAAVADEVDIIEGVECLRWNPVRERDGVSAPVNNFGDLLGPVIVKRIVDMQGLSAPLTSTTRLLSIGSVMHHAADGDTVWGAGVNGKISPNRVTAHDLDIRAVRGPRSRAVLQALGHSVPSVYGDPALLLGRLFPELHPVEGESASLEVTVIPNLNDWESYEDRDGLVSPVGDLWDILRTIARSSFVVGSSLHAIIVAEAFGVPARAVQSLRESTFKYLDYYEGTGRSDVRIARTVDEAIAWGPVLDKPLVDYDALMAAFPSDLWSNDLPAKEMETIELSVDGEQEPNLEFVAADARLDPASLRLSMWLLGHSVDRLSDPQLHRQAPALVRSLAETARLSALHSDAQMDDLSPQANKILRTLFAGDVASLQRDALAKARGAAAEIFEIRVTPETCTLRGRYFADSVDSILIALRARFTREDSGDVVPVRIAHDPTEPTGSVISWSVTIEKSDVEVLSEGAWVLEVVARRIADTDQTVFARLAQRVVADRRPVFDAARFDRTKRGAFVMHIRPRTKEAE